MSASASVLCVIPGLVWPATGLSEVLSTVALPGLSALFAQVKERNAPPCSLDTWLANQFMLSDTVPFAALRLAGEQESIVRSDSLWVCADPVSLRFARQHLLLDAPAKLNLQAAEMTAMLIDLNKTFADVGKFLSTSPEHCYLELNAEHADKLAVTLTPLADVENRPVAQFQARGDQAAWWSKLANELQIFCHNHPINAARESRRAPVLNALWLWGIGRLPRQLVLPSIHIAARLQRPNPILSGLTRLAQNRSDARIDTFDVQHPADWALLDDLHEPAQQRDALRWAQALAMLDEQVFVPLSQQLRDERITQLRIVAPGDTALASFDISPNPRWKFWQRDASKAQLLAALGKPSP